jgi:hypothetical protein
VSEELLDGAEAASLYVYKGKINPQALLRKADELVGASPGSRAVTKGRS